MKTTIAIRVAIGSVAGGIVAAAWWLGLGGTPSFPWDAVLGGSVGGGVCGAISRGGIEAGVAGALGGMGTATVSRYLFLRATA